MRANGVSSAQGQGRARAGEAERQGSGRGKGVRRGSEGEVRSRGKLGTGTHLVVEDPMDLERLDKVSELCTRGHDDALERPFLDLGRRGLDGQMPKRAPRGRERGHDRGGPEAVVERVLDRELDTL